MFKPLSLFIGLRYTRAKRKNHFISFISMVSMLGIAIGVMVLITVLSVMNGFDREIKSRIFSMVPAVTISSLTGSIDDWQPLQGTLAKNPTVIGVAPYVTSQVLLSYGSGVQPAMVNGILPEEENRISVLFKKMIAGNLNELKPNEFNIVLGEVLASRLNVKIGDKVTLITPQVSLTPVGVIPWSKRFTVSGIFRAGSGFGFDAGLGFIHLSDAQKLMGLKEKVSGLHLSIDNVYAAPAFARSLLDQLSPIAVVNTWVDQFGEFFHAIQLEKTMMFFILMLIIAVAAFNLVSTLIMVVNEKQSDIAILRTFGATPRMIMMIFIIQGGLIGFFGTTLGVILGLLLSFNVTELVNWVEVVFHVQFLSSNVYFVNYLPSEVEWLDVLKISIAAFCLSIVATIYPAFRAASLDPVESLRYE